jgi:hypothetical protein
MMKSCRLWLNVFADLLRFSVLSLRSESALAAENLYLRKQLAFYKDRRIKPRRTSYPTRLTLLWLSRWFNWRSCLSRRPHQPVTLAAISVGQPSSRITLMPSSPVTSAL